MDTPRGGAKRAGVSEQTIQAIQFNRDVKNVADAAWLWATTPWPPWLCAPWINVIRTARCG